MLLDSVAEKRDFWLIYQMCPGQTLNEHLFSLKGEFYKNERIYMIQHGGLFKALRTDLLLLRDFLSKICQAIGIFSKLGIVHADLKPENVIIDFDQETRKILSLKIIDLGSSFLLNPEGHVVEHQ